MPGPPCGPPPPPPLAADALNVEPPMAIAAAAKAIAILRIMMLTPFVLSTPAFPNQTQQFPLSCSLRHTAGRLGFGIRAAEIGTKMCSPPALHQHSRRAADRNARC